MIRITQFHMFTLGVACSCGKIVICNFWLSERCQFYDFVVDDVLLGNVPTRNRYALETKTKQDNPVVYETCDACQVTCVRLCEWESHIHSKRHHKQLASIRKSKQRMERAYVNLSDTLTKYELGLSQVNAAGDPPGDPAYSNVTGSDPAVNQLCSSMETARNMLWCLLLSTYRLRYIVDDVPFVLMVLLRCINLNYTCITSVCHISYKHFRSHQTNHANCCNFMPLHVLVLSTDIVTKHN